MSEDLLKFVDTFEIDNKRKVTPFKTGKDHSITYTDHYAISVKFKEIPYKSRHERVGRRFTRWNTHKPKGWETYRNLTSSNPRFDSIAESDIDDPNVIMKKIEKELTAVKFKAFGKVKVRNQRKRGKLEELIDEKAKLLSGSHGATDDLIIKADSNIVEELVK